MKLKPFNSFPIEGTPSITIGIDQSTTSTGVCVQVNGTSYICVIQRECKPIDDMFLGVQFKDFVKVDHITLHTHKRINSIIMEMDTFINTVLMENGLNTNNVSQIRMESLAMTQKGRSIIDLSLLMEGIITYISDKFSLDKLHLIAAPTLKKACFGKQKRRAKTEPKEHPKKKMLDFFNKRFGTNLKIRSTKNPNEDAVDCYALANMVNI